MTFSATHITISGDLSKSSSLVQQLGIRNYVVTILPNLSEEAINGLLLLIIDDPGILEGTRGIKIPWVAWCFGSEELIANVYDAGATAVFPANMDENSIVQIIDRLSQSIMNPPQKTSTEGKQRRYQRGDVILLESDIVLEVVNGIIAQIMIFQDGSDVMMGLFGPKSLVIPHPADKCFIQLVAHTDVSVMLKTWPQASVEEGFCERLRCRLQQIEAWSSMQARPNIQQRVFGILSLLSEQFGETTPEGRLLSIRFTHAQLASAVGSTRATITRTLGDLKKQGCLVVKTTVDGERFCLLKWENGRHSSFH